jgi:RNA polymerase sigma-70 factor (TIGR02960 family)
MRREAMPGDGSYVQLVEPHRAELRAHCRRMLGSPDDAEDALQETLVRAWRALPRFEGRGSVRSWLYRIATNASLEVLNRRHRRVLPIDDGPRADPPDGASETLEVPEKRPGPDARYEQRESVELAFEAAQRLRPPRQRAVLILREVLGYSAAETADALETSVAAVNSALQRARSTLESRAPERDRLDARAPSRAHHRSSRMNSISSADLVSQMIRERHGQESSTAEPARHHSVPGIALAHGATASPPGEQG